MNLTLLVSVTGRITSGTTMNSPQKVYVDERGVVGQGSLRVGPGSSVVVVGQNGLRVGEDSPAVERGFPGVGRDSPVVEHVSLVVREVYPVVGQDSPVVEQGSQVVGQELPVVRLDSVCVKQGSLQIWKGSLKPPTNVGFLFGYVSTVVGHLGKSSSLGQTSRVVRGPTRSGHSFRSLSVILVFLLTAIAVTSASQCPSNSEDLTSRTVFAKVIFVGQYVGQSSRLEPTVEGLWTAEFKVEEPLKGTVQLSNGRVHVSGLSRDGGEGGCAGGNFTVKGKYYVFLNGSVGVEGRDDGSRQIYWTSGPPVEFSKAAKKTVEKYSCPKCAEAPKVKPMPRPPPPIDLSGSLMLRCRTSGKPTPTITWYKGPEVVSVDNRRIRTTRQGAQLSIRRVIPSDAGLYKCHASNVLGSANSTNVNVTVKEASDNTSTSPTDHVHVVRCGQQVFCLNGGTCLTHPILGQFCACPEGFTGQRCQDRSVSIREKKTRPEKPLDLNLRNLLIVGLILVGLILLVLAVIAYCLAMTRYDNARRMSHWTAEETEEPDVRANGAILRSLNGLQSEKLKKFTTSNGAGDPSSVDDSNKKVGLPQVLVTLIEDEGTRTTIASGKGGDLPSEGNAKRPEVRVYCPPDQCSTFPNLTRPRLAAVSTTPSSAASSINLHMDHTGPTSAEEQLDSGNC